MKKETGWAIADDFGLYYGWWKTRREAIYHHCKNLGKGWIYCKKKGDKAVKITINYTP